MALVKRLSTALTAVLSLLSLCPDTALSLPSKYRYEVNHVPRYIQPYGLDGQVSDWGTTPLRTEFEPQEENYDYQTSDNAGRYPVVQRRNSYSNPHVSYEIARLAVGQEINHIPVVSNPQSLLPGDHYEQQYESYPDQPTFQSNPMYSHSINTGTGPLSVAFPSSTATNNRKEDHVSSSISQGIQNTISAFESDHFIRNDGIISNADIDAAVDIVTGNLQTHTKRESPASVNNQQPITFPSDILVVAPAAVVPGYDHPAIVNQQIVPPYPSQQPSDAVNRQQYPAIPNPGYPSGSAVAPNTDAISAGTLPNRGYPTVPESQQVPAAIVPISGYPIVPGSQQVPAAIVPISGYPTIPESQQVPAAIVPISGYPSVPDSQQVPAAIVPISGYPSAPGSQQVPAAIVPISGYPTVPVGQPNPASEVIETQNTGDNVIPAAVVPDAGYPSVQVPNPGYPPNAQEQIIPSVEVPNPELPSNTESDVIDGPIQPISEVAEIDSAYPSNTADAVTPTVDSINKNHKPISIYPTSDKSNVASSSSNNDNSNEANSLNNQQSAEQGGSISNNQNSVEVTGGNNVDSVERTVNKNVFYFASTSETEPVENPLDIFPFSRKRPVSIQYKKDNIDETPASEITDSDVQTIDISQIVLPLEQRTELSQIEDNLDNEIDNLEVTTEVPATEEYLPESETDIPPITESSISEDFTTDETIPETIPESSTTTLSEAEKDLINAKLSFVYNWNNEVYRRGLYFLRIENIYPETGYVYMPDIERYTQYIQSTPSVKFLTSHLLESYKAVQESSNGVISTETDQNTEDPTLSLRDSSQPSLSENDQAFLLAYNKLIAQFHPNMEKLYPLISHPITQNLNPAAFNQFVSPIQGFNFPEFINRNQVNAQSNLVDTGRRPVIPGFVRPLPKPESDRRPL